MAEKKVSKRELNKHKKERNLLEAARGLFIEQGIQNTTVNDIVRKAGVAKGTFYLYYKDKSEIEEQLITRETTGILLAAIEQANQEEDKSFQEQFLVAVDYIIDYLQENESIVEFINKNLSYAIYSLQKDHLEKASIKNIYEQVYSSYVEHAKPLNIENPEIVIGLCIEFLGATIYSSLVYKMPKPIHELRPYLHEIISLIFSKYLSD